MAADCLHARGGLREPESNCIRGPRLPERFLDAADLLAEPDPGPTAFLVDDLIVDAAIVAAVGKWKTMKSYALLDIAISIAAGRPAFGRLEIPEPGAVVFVNEESGKAALWRRLDALSRGRAVAPSELRGRLIVAPNSGVKLDDARWQNELLDLGEMLKPRLFIFDPLARMKASSREENSQTDMAEIVEFIRLLRDRSAAAICFVHHQGHTGGNMRGSSDLESVWETRLTWTREGQSPVVTIQSEHREAEAGEPLEFRAAWHADTRTMRLELEPDPVLDRIENYLRHAPDATANEVNKDLGGNRKKVLALVKHLRDQGGSGPLEPLGTAPSRAPSESGSPATPFKGAGNHLEKPGTNSPEPPASGRRSE